MPKITVANFRATTPRVSSRLIEPNQAQTAANINISENRLKALKQPSAISALAVGSDICQYGEYASGTGQWAGYSSNVVSNDGGALKVQYVDGADGQGAYTYLANSGELTADLTVGRLYQVTAKLKVSAGNSVLFAWWNGSIWTTLATITVTDFATVTVYFTATHATTNAIGFVGMSGSEAIWLDDLTVKECSANTRTLWKCGANYIAVGTVDAECSVVDSPIQESLNRFMFTGDSYPKQSDSTQWATRATQRLGVTPPAVAPSVTMSGTPDVSVQKYVSYYFTMVNSQGEESKPGPATSIITVMDGEHVDLSVMTTPTDAGADFKYKRIYRLETGKAGGQYQFLAEIATAATTYEDKGTGTTLGTISTDVCETEGWDIPPDGLAGLCQGPNGMILGYYGKEVYISEPGAPYAWPSEYKIQLDSDVTGLKATRDFILAVSSRYPYIITGSTPESLVKTQLSQVMQCTSNRGIVSMEKGIYFPTKEGLAFCDGTNVTCVTDKIITKEQWATMIAPGDIMAAWYEERYVAVYKDGSTGFKYCPDLEEISTFTLTSYLDTIRGIYSDASTGLLVVLGTLASTPGLYSFDSSASYLTYTWKSKRFMDNDRYSVAKVKGDFTSGKTLTFYWYLNGTAKNFGTGDAYKTVSSETAFRLPSDSGSQDKEFQLVGTAFIDSVQIATSPEELT